MDDLAFLELVRRRPFGECSELEWHALAARLLASLSVFLTLPLEFVGGRQPDRDNFSPLIRSVGEVFPALGLRLAGMISCGTTSPNSGLRVVALFFLFAGGERLAPPDRQFFTYDYLGSGEGPEWVSCGWQTSDFPEQWDAYTFQRFFDGLKGDPNGYSS